MRTDAQQTDPATIARELWARGYSLAYIAARLGVSRTAAVELIGVARIVSRERRRGRA